MKYVLIVCCLLATASAEKHGSKVIPKVTSVTLDEQSVTVIHLCPGYTTSIKVPEEVSSVTVGDPANFKIEHSEIEPRLVFLKPITMQPVQSNALITTRSGQEISLHLISDGPNGTKDKVDFVLEYSRPRSFFIRPSTAAFEIPASPVAMDGIQTASGGGSIDRAEAQLLKQSALASPDWKGKELQIALSEVRADGNSTVLAFSVLNRSGRTVELLVPQIQLDGNSKRRGIKAEPIPVGEYRITRQRLQPGERADGVVVFERPQFKESEERLTLRLATVEAVDRPLAVPIPFVPVVDGGLQ